jgi:hypothetical protein
MRGPTAALVLLALAISFLVAVQKPVAAQTPTFTIDLISPYKTTYNLGESVLIYTRITNTGSSSIDHAWGTVSVVSPGGQLVMNQNWDSDCYSIAPGAVCVFQATWYMPGDAEQGTYRILVGVTAAIGSTQRAQTETACSGTCVLNFVVMPEFSDFVGIGAVFVLAASVLLVYRRRKNVNREVEVIRQENLRDQNSK